jgi:hypothetical protein
MFQIEEVSQYEYEFKLFILYLYSIRFIFISEFILKHGNLCYMNSIPWVVYLGNYPKRQTTFARTVHLLVELYIYLCCLGSLEKLV